MHILYGSLLGLIPNRKLVLDLDFLAMTCTIIFGQILPVTSNGDGIIVPG